MKATIFVPATIGNVGPGFDVLGLAVEGLGDTVTVELVDGPDAIVEVTGRDADRIPRDPAANCVVIAARAILRVIGVSHGVRVTLERGLPVSGGLGASAAASVGGALAAVHASAIDVGSDLVLRAALEAEAFVAGRHLDNIAPCLFGGLCLVREVSPPDVVRLPINGEWWITVVTPNQKLATKTARGVLPDHVTRSEFVQQLANTGGVIAAFGSGDHQLMRRSLHDVFAEPRRAGLIENYADVRAAADTAGALGCAISGAGPSMFALSADEPTALRVAAAMTSAFGDGASAHVGRPAMTGARQE